MTSGPAPSHYSFPKISKTVFLEERQVSRRAPVPGVQLVGYLTEALHRFFGPENWSRYGELSVSFLEREVMAGDRVTVAGKLVERKVDSSGCRVVVSIWIDNETQGHRVAEAEARCHVP